MSISGKVGAIFMQTADAAVVFTDAPMTDSGDHAIYYITDGVKRYWDKETAVTVEVDGTPVTNFTVQYPGGRIVLDTPLTGVEVVTASGKYLTLAEVGGFYSWNLDMESDMADITTFASNGWKENEPTIKGFKASAEAFWQDDVLSDNLGIELALVFYVDDVNLYRYECFGKISGDSIGAKFSEIISEKIEIQGNGQLYYRAG